MRSEPTTCIHCGQRIVRDDFIGKEAWTHQRAGAAFRDGMHRPCHLTVATPPPDERTQP